jgi:hypothetical protein
VRLRLPYVIPGVLLVLIGLVWVLQGSGVLQGSFMTGQKLWLIIGVIVGLAGLGLAYLGLTPRARRT